MKKTLGIIVLVIIVFAAGLYLAYSFGKKSVEQPSGQDVAVQPTPESKSTPLQAAATPEEPQAIPVRVAAVEQKEIAVTQTFYGTSVPYDEANVQGKYGGKIVSLKGEEGDDVKKGEVVVRFDDSDTQLQLQQATASKNSALERVNQAQSDFDTIQEDVNRQENLFKEGIVPQKTVDDARNRLQSAQAALNTALEGVKQAESQIDLLNNTLKDLKIAAPISGVIDEKHYNLNEIYRAGDILYHIIDIDRVYVEVEVPETYISQVKEKMEVAVIFDSLVEQEFTGTIERIAPKGDPQSRSFLAKAVVKNAERTIKPGMFARVNVTVKSLPEALVIDRKALLQEGDRFSVFNVVDDQVHKVPVIVKHRDEVSVAVESEGLQSGDHVVVEGVTQLKPDDRVTIK